MINEDRLRRLFLELTSINSPPGQEAPVTDFCEAVLQETGFETRRDDAGNLFASRGLDQGGQPIFLSGHMDTVAPTAELQVVEEEGVFRTNGRSILGADDKCAVAAFLEAAYQIEEQRLRHGPLWIALSVQEEVGLMGAKQMDLSPLRGALGFVFDASGRTGAIITAAPSHDYLEFRVQGKAAHAGFAPEKGVSAIVVASRAIASMRLGRIDEETTANIGLIQGGAANNIVAEDTYVKAEARSRDEQKLAAQVAHMRERFDAAAAELGAAVQIDHRRAYTGYRHDPDSPLLRLAADGLRRAGHEPTYRATGGGSDANIFMAAGLPAVVLSCGYVNAHSIHEHLPFADLRLNAEWSLGIIGAAAV